MSLVTILLKTKFRSVKSMSRDVVSILSLRGARDFMWIGVVDSRDENRGGK